MKPLSVAQRRVLRALVAAGGSKLVVTGEGGLPRVTINHLAGLGLVRVQPGGTTSKCPRSGIDVFQPGPSTAHITDEGRRVEQIDRTGVDAGGAR